MIFAQTTTATGEGAATNADDIDKGLESACDLNPGLACEWVYERTGNEFLAKATDWVLGAPLRVILILAVAWLASHLLKRVVKHFAHRLTQTTTAQQLRGLKNQNTRSYWRAAVDERKRARARASTIASVLSSLAFAGIWLMACLMVLGEINIEIAPLIAGAGIAGIAIGFGAQTIVRDFLSGIFMLIEDQFGVGDIVDVGEASGTIEKVSLRTTTLRDVTGVVWHIPNGEIHRVANKSQLWSRALLDIEVAYGTDLRLAEGVIQKVADEMWENPEWGGDEIMERPEVWGIQNLGADGVSIRLVAKTEPATQWAVERELRLRIKEALDAAGIEIPYPQRTVWVRDEGTHPLASKPDPKTIPVSPIGRYKKDLEEPIVNQIRASGQDDE